MNQLLNIKECIEFYSMLYPKTSADMRRICYESVSLIKSVISRNSDDKENFIVQISNGEFLGSCEKRTDGEPSIIRFGGLAFRSDHIKRASLGLYLTGLYDMNESVFYATLTATTGTIIHEALHHLFTPSFDISSTLRNAMTNQMMKVDSPRMQLVSSLFNLVEDIFIESVCSRLYGDLMFFIKGKNGIYFDDVALEGIRESFLDRRDLASAVDILITMKRLVNEREVLETKPFSDGAINKCVQLLLQIHDNAVSETPRIPPHIGLKYRIEVTIELFKILTEEFGGEGIFSDADLKSEIGSYGGIELTGDEAAEAVEIGEDPRDLPRKLEAASKAMVPNESEMSAINRTLSSLDSSPLGEVVFPDEKSITVSYDVEELMVPIVDFLPYKVKLDFEDEKWQELGHRIRAAVSVDRHVEPPQLHGRVNGRYLSRLAVDGKVLSRDREISKRSKNWEIFILVDASGSMRTMEERAIVAASGVLRSLKAAGIKCRMFAHTADYVIEKAPTNFGEVSNMLSFISKATVIYDFGNATDETLNAYMSVVRNTMVLYENRDGYAIDYVAGKFSDHRLARGLIVISDGAPHANGYREEYAMKHTREVVARARENGIKVVSLSISPDAINPNNQIYGKEFNVIASPESCGTIAEQLITQ